MDEYVTIKAYNAILDKLDRIENMILEKSKSEKSKNDIEGFINTEDLCWTFKLSKETVRRYRKEGIIPSYKIKGKVYFKLDEVKQAIKERFVYGSNRCQ